MGCTGTITLKQFLREEVKPALGCTEPVAVALAVARAREELGEKAEKADVLLSSNVFKNGATVGIPGTDGLKGNDVAAALADLRARAGKLGFDPDSIILMGHSAGAHLAALVSTDPRYFETADVPMAAIRGTILLDGAGYDVPRQMESAGPMLGKMYRDAFTTDKEMQLRLSPMAHVAQPNVANWLILFDKGRADSGSQSNTLATALKRAGSAVSAIPVSDTSHMKLNRDMGVDGDPATRLADTFIERIL